MKMRGFKNRELRNPKQGTMALGKLLNSVEVSVVIALQVLLSPNFSFAQGDGPACPAIFAGKSTSGSPAKDSLVGVGDGNEMSDTLKAPKALMSETPLGSFTPGEKMTAAADLEIGSSELLKYIDYLIELQIRLQSNSFENRNQFLQAHEFWTRETKSLTSLSPKHLELYKKRALEV